MSAKDKTGSTTFTLFNKEAEQLIGIPVEKIINGLPEVNSDLKIKYKFIPYIAFN